MKISQFRSQLTKYFNKEELINLCFDLEINHQSLPGDTLEDMARELITYCQRHGHLVALIKKCHELRPRARWPTLKNPGYSEMPNPAGQDIDGQGGGRGSIQNAVNEKKNIFNEKEKKEYFVGHQFTNKNIKDLRKIIADVFVPRGFNPYYPDENIGGQPLLERIAKKVFTSYFCIFDLTTTSPNVFIELGIALALNRFVLIIAQEGVEVPGVFKDHNILRYTGLVDLKNKLTALSEGGFPPTEHTWSDYCYFCEQKCSGINTAEEENSFLLLDNSPLLWLDLKTTFQEILQDRHLFPVSLTDFSGSQLSPLSEMRRKTLSSQFSICDVGKSNSDSFLALGLAIGSRKPWLLLSEKENVVVPSNLRGYDRLEYEALHDFRERRFAVLNNFLDLIMPSPNPSPDAQTVAHVPFWVALDDWIHKQSRKDKQTDQHEQIEGQIRIIRFDDNKHTATYFVPETGLLVGRDSDCDLKIADPFTSGHHFRIIRGGETTYFIVDLGSKHGTFHNNKRLVKNEPKQLKLRDEIYIQSGHIFYVWDYHPIDFKAILQTDFSREKGSTKPAILKIELHDIRIPTYIDSLDQEIIINIIHPDSNTVTYAKVQAYYPFGKILDKILELLNFPTDREYHFVFGGKRIDTDSTPILLGLQSQNYLQIISSE